MEEQEKAPILGSAMYFHHMFVIFRTKKILQVLMIGIWENIPLMIGMKLLPKDGNFLLCDCFTDGNWVFHFISSR